MKIHEYISKHGIYKAAFARLVGASPSAVTRWIDGSRRPELEQVRAISTATFGEITVEDFYDTRCASDDWRCRVKAWARVRGVEMRAIARKIGVNPCTFSGWMSGAANPSAENARKIISATDKTIPLEAFLGKNNNLVSAKTAGKRKAALHKKRSRVHAR